MFFFLRFDFSKSNGEKGKEIEVVKFLDFGSRDFGPRFVFWMVSVSKEKMDLGTMKC